MVLLLPQFAGSRSPRGLLDTTVFSFLLRDDSRRDLYDEELASARPFFLSAMTVCELQSGVEVKGWGVKRRAAMERHIAQFTVLPIDQPLVRKSLRTVIGC